MLEKDSEKISKIESSPSKIGDLGWGGCRLPTLPLHQYKIQVYSKGVSTTCSTLAIMFAFNEQVRFEWGDKRLLSLLKLSTEEESLLGETVNSKIPRFPKSRNLDLKNLNLLCS